MTKLTFIMSVLNTRHEWIQRAVDSIIKQTDPDWELIIVDDGSKEPTAEYLDELSQNDDRIIIHHQENQGLSVARNYGMDNASAKWVTFIDADDWLETTYVEEIVTVLGEHEGIDALAIGHDDIWGEKTIDQLWGTNLYHEFTEADREGEQMALLQLPEGLDEYPMFFGGQWKLVYSLDFLNKYHIRNTPGLYKAQDSVFNLYVTENAKRIGYYNKVLYHYFHNNESVTGSGFNPNIERFQRLLIAYKRFIDDTGKSNNDRYIDAYVKIGLVQFNSILDKYLFNKDNKESNLKKKKVLKEVLNTEPYKEILKLARKSKLKSYKFLMIVFMRRNAFYLIYCLFSLKRILA